MAFFRFEWPRDERNPKDAWGTGTHYFEIDQTGRTTRRLEIYENGKVLKYDHDHQQDAEGRLHVQTIPPETWKWMPFEQIDADEFEIAWQSYTRNNR